MPLLVGMVWMVGAMVALDLHLNFMNIFVITMIIGIGVDYGIHVIHRYREEEARRAATRRRRSRRRSRGVFLAALTTSSASARSPLRTIPGLISMGLVSTLGTLATALVAIVVIPAYLSWRTSPQPNRSAGGRGRGRLSRRGARQRRPQRRRRR